MVTDPQGRKLGFDPRLNKGIAEFQGAYDPSFDLINEVSDEYQTKSYINMMLGEYTIELINRVNEEFTLIVPTLCVGTNRLDAPASKMSPPAAPGGFIIQADSGRFRPSRNDGKNAAADIYF